MSPKKINVIAEKYELQLKQLHIKASRQTHKKLGSLKALSHALWMCGQLRSGMPKEDMENACLWLGFIQGILWTRGVYTMEQLRRDNI